MVRYRLCYTDDEGTTHRYYSNSLDYLNSLRGPFPISGHVSIPIDGSWLEERIDGDTYVRMRE